MQFHVQNDAGQAYLVAFNDGGRHETIRDVTLTTSTGSGLKLAAGVSPYILAGATSRWRIAAATAVPAPGGSLRLTGQAGAGTVDQTGRRCSGSMSAGMPASCLLPTDGSFLLAKQASACRRLHCKTLVGGRILATLAFGLPSLPAVAATLVSSFSVDRGGSDQSQHLPDWACQHGARHPQRHSVANGTGHFGQMHRHHAV